MTDYSVNPLNRSSFCKLEKEGWYHDQKESIYSFASQNYKSRFDNSQIKKSSTSPLRCNPSRKSDQAENIQKETSSNGNSMSRSRSRSGYRKISHSPVEINTSYELSHKNTEHLWKEFRTSVRERSSPRNTKPLRKKSNNDNISDVQYQSCSNMSFQNHNNRDIKNLSINEIDSNSKNLVEGSNLLSPVHFAKPSLTHHIDTNQFIGTSKAEIK